MVKNKTLLLYLLLIFSISACAQPQNAPAQFFRQQNIFQTGRSEIIDQPVWTTHLDGPLRGSCGFDAEKIYTGTAAGVLYALDKKSGRSQWTFSAGAAIHSTPAVENNRLWFTDNHQTLYCLDTKTGRLQWKHDFGPRLPYEWKFDYWYSSPVIDHQQLLVGSDDGYMNCLDKNTGRVIWRYNAKEVIRSSALVQDGTVYFGDCAGKLYAVSATDGKEKWAFETKGYHIQLGGEWYYDRRAILATPAISGDICTVGSRDGYLYGVNKNTGQQVWVLDYKITWVISSAVIDDDKVIVGTSDGKYINAVDVHTGKEVWRHITKGIVWSSAIVINGMVYMPGNDGVLYILNEKTGAQVSEYRLPESCAIFCSPVFDGKQVYFGSDIGLVTALGSRPFDSQLEQQTRKYVFWMDSLFYFFRPSTSTRLRDYLVENGYQLIDSFALTKIMKGNNGSVAHSVIAFASNYYPDSLLMDPAHSLIRQYLDKGGKMISFGMNPIIYAPSSFLFSRAKTILGVDYGPDDLRSFHGLYPSFPTETGKKYFLPSYWTGMAAVKKEQVDQVLGMDENGLASSWIKFYGSSAARGAYIQAWIDPTRFMDYNFIKWLKDIPEK